MADLGLTPEARKGIGPATQPSTMPLDADVDCPGPPLWQADDNDRQAGAWATSNFQGKYWVQEPVEGVGPNHKEARYTPLSDTTGSIPYGEAASVGDMGDPESFGPAARPDINNRS